MSAHLPQGRGQHFDGAEGAADARPVLDPGNGGLCLNVAQHRPVRELPYEQVRLDGGQGFAPVLVDLNGHAAAHSP